MVKIRDQAKVFLWGRKRYGSAGNRDHARNVSLEDEFDHEDGESFTRFDAIESSWAEADEEDRLRDRHQLKLNDTLWQLAEKLPAEWRTALKMRYQRDLSFEEITRRTGLSSCTVKRFLRYAVQQLRAELRALGYRPLAPDAPLPASGPTKGTNCRRPAREHPPQPTPA